MDPIVFAAEMLATVPNHMPQAPKMVYTRADVLKVKTQIRAVCPNVNLDDWEDYGFRLVGYKEGPDGVPVDFIVLFQPAYAGRNHIMADVDAAIKIWSGK